MASHKGFADKFISGKLLAFFGAVALVLFGLISGPAAFADTSAAALKGSILTIDLKAKTVQVVKSDNSIATVSFSKKTEIVRNGKSAKIKTLMLRDAIQVKYKNGAPATKFTVMGPSSKKLAGKLTDASQGQGKLVINGKTIQTTAQTRIVRNGHVVSLSTLTTKDTLVAHLKPVSKESVGEDEAIDIICSGPEDDELHGTISAIAGNQVTVSPLNGTADVTVNVVDATMIEVDGEDASLADLAVGMEVETHFDPTTFDAYVIETDSHPEDDDAHISGTVTATDLGLGTITIAPTTGDAVTLTVDAATEIEVNGDSAGLADITVGLTARAEYDSTTLRAKEIKAGDDFGGHNGGGGNGGGDHEDNDLQGVIAEVNVDAATVTVTPDGGGDALVLNVTAQSELEVNDHHGSIQDLVVGQSVKVEYDTTTNDILELKVEGSDDGGGDGGGNHNGNGEVTGTVSAVDLEAATITIDPNGDGENVTLTVTGDTEIKVNGEHATLADVVVNAPVKAEYDSTTNEASEIKVGDNHS